MTEQLTVHRTDGLGLGGRRDVHPGAHHVVERCAGLGECLLDDGETPSGLVRRALGTTAARQHGAGARDQDALAHPDSAAETDTGLEGRARRDPLALDHAPHPPTRCPGGPQRPVRLRPTGGGMGLRRRIGILAGAGVLAIGVAALVLAAVGVFAGSPAAPSSTHDLALAPPTTTAPSTTTTTTAPPAPAGPPASTIVATTNGAIPGYASPDSPTPSMTVPGSWYGYPSKLPVITSEPGWLYVRLAQRPNGSTIWVRQSDVTLSSTPYAIVVNLTTMRLQVYDDGSQIFDFPAGIGAPDDPTPPGQYFVPMQYPSPGPGYGPFVLVTSDHSDTITDWENSGDAVIGIHGPITSYDDSLIGTTGAAISHGCIRLHDADLAQLSIIPPGTPIDIVG